MVFFLTLFNHPARAGNSRSIETSASLHNLTCIKIILDMILCFSRGGNTMYTTASATMTFLWKCFPCDNL